MRARPPRPHALTVTVPTPCFLICVGAVPLVPLQTASPEVLVVLPKVPTSKAPPRRGYRLAGFVVTCVQGRGRHVHHAVAGATVLSDTGAPTGASAGLKQMVRCVCWCGPGVCVGCWGQGVEVSPRPALEAVCKPCCWCPPPPPRVTAHIPATHGRIKQRPHRRARPAPAARRDGGPRPWAQARADFSYGGSGRLCHPPPCHPRSHC